jgi:hypothetical protein
MIKYTKYILACILFSFFQFQSCVINPDPIDVLIPPVEQKLVISSFAYPPFGTLIAVSKSFDALFAKDTINFDSTDLLNKILVSNAIVTITYNNKTIDLKEIFPGIYGSIDLEYEQNTDYNLKVLDPATNLFVEAKTQILSNASITNAKPIFNPIDSIFTYEILWQDEVNKDNFYLITSNKLSNSQKIFSNIEKTFLSTLSSTFNVITEKNNKGGKYEYSPEFTNYLPTDTLLVTLSNITKEHYDFISAYKKRGSVLNSILSEPIRSLPSNISGGYGFFALYNIDAKIIYR